MNGHLLRLTAVTAIGPATWGTTYLVTTELLPPGRPLLAATVRALPIGLLMVALGGQLPRGVWWWKALVLGALNIGVFFALLFFAAYRLPGGVAATLGAVQPLVVAVISVPLLGARLRGWTLVVGSPGSWGCRCSSCVALPRSTGQGWSQASPRRARWPPVSCSPNGGADRSPSSGSRAGS